MARLGHRQRSADRLQISDLAYTDDVRILSKHLADGRRERRGVAADLTLVHDGELVTVQILDRVLDRDDMHVLVIVDVGDHRGHRGRLAGPRGTTHEHEAVHLLTEVLHDERNAKVLHGRDLPWEMSDGGGHTSPLEIDIESESPQPFGAYRGIETLLRLQLGYPFLIDHRVGELATLEGIQRRPVTRDEGPVDPELRWHARGDVKVGRSPLNHLFQKFAYLARHGAPRISIPGQASAGTRPRLPGGRPRIALESNQVKS
jgi:hypothetical protein